MAIIVHCLDCAKKWQLRKDPAGKRIKCPSCGKALIVSVSEHASPVKPAKQWLVGGLCAVGGVLALVVIFLSTKTAAETNMDKTTAALFPCTSIRQGYCSLVLRVQPTGVGWRPILSN
jgi:DNA-directed RNA polymerase subunit RPC12/RpoP